MYAALPRLQRAAGLARVLSVSVPDLMRMADAEPRVLAFSDEAMQRTVEAIAGLCGIRESAVGPLLMLQPAILQQPDLLRLHFVSLMQQLGLPRAEVEDIVRRCPQVLSLAPAELRHQLRHLSTVLQQHQLYDHGKEQPQQQQQQPEAAVAPPPPGFARLVAAVCQEPSLLLQDPASLAAWVQHIASHLQGLPAAAGQAGASKAARQGGDGDVSPTPTLAPSPSGLDAWDAVAQLLLLKPSLLSTPASVVWERMQHLAKRSGRPIASGTCDASTQVPWVGGGSGYAPGLLTEPASDGLRPGCVLEAVGRGPDLVAVTSCSLDRRADEVVELLGLQAGRQEFYLMLLASPSLMTAPLGGLANRWRTLQAIASMIAPPVEQEPTDGSASTTDREATQGRPGASPSTPSALSASPTASPASSSPCGTPAAAGLRPDLKAALMTGSFSRLARLKYLLSLRSDYLALARTQGAVSAEGRADGFQDLLPGQGPGNILGTRDTSRARVQRRDGAFDDGRAPAWLEAGEVDAVMESAVEEVLGASDAAFNSMYPGYKAWLAT